jgi:hypothetical protein
MDSGRACRDMPWISALAALAGVVGVLKGRAAGRLSRTASLACEAGRLSRTASLACGLADHETARTVIDSRCRCRWSPYGI